MTYQKLSHYVYLDYAATSPLCEQAQHAMQPYMAAGLENLCVGANANSLHTPGRNAFVALEQARRDFSRTIGAKRPDEIIFTSGATEADNLAIMGLAQAAFAAHQKKQRSSLRPCVLCSELEHDAVLHPVNTLKQQGFDVAFVRPNRQGIVTAEALEKAITPQTVLVSIQAANAEIGSIQPISALAHIAHDFGALFHTDATQALGKIPFDAEKLGVDAASFASHKVYGPKGVGAMYLKARTPLVAQQLGGGQENARRSGTQNVCGVVGFAAAACDTVSKLASEGARLARMRDNLYERLRAIPGVTPTVDIRKNQEHYIPPIVHVLVKGFESETLILRLDALGFGVSGGSACASHSLDPSHVLTAIGIPRDDAQGALRVSFGRYTTQDELDAFACALKACIEDGS